MNFFRQIVWVPNWIDSCLILWMILSRGFCETFSCVWALVLAPDGRLYDGGGGCVDCEAQHLFFRLGDCVHEFDFSIVWRLWLELSLHAWTFFFRCVCRALGSWLLGCLYKWCLLLILSCNIKNIKN